MVPCSSILLAALASLTSLAGAGAGAHPALSMTVQTVRMMMFLRGVLLCCVLYCVFCCVLCCVLSSRRLSHPLLFGRSNLYNLENSTVIVGGVCRAGDIGLLFEYSMC
jgi:hypothetical protein